MVKSYFVLLDIGWGKGEQVARILRSTAGVRIAEPLKGSADVVMLVEAPERKKLADLTYQAVASLSDVSSNVRILPVYSD